MAIADVKREARKEIFHDFADDPGREAATRQRLFCGFRSPTSENGESQKGIIMVWVDNDLTALAGGTLANVGGPLDGYSQDDSSQHVNFVDGNGHVHELYRSPDPAAQWVDNDLTALAGGTQAFGAGLVGYSQDDGSQHVYFNALTDVGSSTVHVHELYRSPDPAAQWVDNDLTALAGGTPSLGNQLDGYPQGDGSQHVNFIDENGHVHELYGSP